MGYTTEVIPSVFFWVHREMLFLRRTLVKYALYSPCMSRQRWLYLCTQTSLLDLKFSQCMSELATLLLANK